MPLNIKPHAIKYKIYHQTQDKWTMESVSMETGDFFSSKFISLDQELL